MDDGTSYCCMSGGNGNLILGTGDSYESMACSVVGGAYNTVGGMYSSVKSGYNNLVLGEHATVSHGLENEALSDGSTIVGGSENTATGDVATISGAELNIVTGSHSVVLAGTGNEVKADNSLAIGVAGIIDDYQSAVFAFSGNDCTSMGDNTINICTGSDGFQNNGVQVLKLDDTNEFTYSVDGKYLKFTTLLGGVSNSAIEEYTGVAGGVGNKAAGDYGVAFSGNRNKVWSNYGVVTGGFQNQVTGRFGTISGGSRNFARGRFSMALGYQADAKHDHSAVIALTGDGCTSTEENQVKVCADKFVLNGQDILPKLESASSRYLKEVDFEDQIVANNKLISELEKRNAEQDSTIHQRQKTIDELTKLVAELQASV